MSFDVRAPQNLKLCQQWFASIIVRPIDRESRMNPTAPSGSTMEIEAAKYITPSKSLTSAQRIQIYNQQYWWRLLSILHDTFPLLVRLFGYSDFNAILGKPYLDKYPPDHWSLNMLGNNLPKWVNEHYHADDRQLIICAAEIDAAYNQSFVAPELPPLTFDRNQNQINDSLADIKLRLQPTIFLFQLDYDLFDFRREFLKQDPDYWIDNEFPTLKQGKKNFLLCRNNENDVVWCTISPEEYTLLNYFSHGASINEACEWLELQSSELFEESLKNIQSWLQQWIVRNWLTSDAEVKTLFN